MWGSGQLLGNIGGSGLVGLRSCEGNAEPMTRRPVRTSHAQSGRAPRTDTGRPHSQRYWSQDVTRTSNALDLEPGVFTWNDPARIAQSLKHSAEISARRKGTPLQSAMSMLNFYINRAGRGLPDERRRVLERAKAELRRAFKSA